MCKDGSYILKKKKKKSNAGPHAWFTVLFIWKPDNYGHNILTFFLVLPNLKEANKVNLKQSVIISKKHGIYELPQELPNDVKVRILENKGILGKS